MTSFREAGLEVTRETFRGVTTAAETERLTAIVASSGCDVVVGIGGGSVIDAAKIVGNDAGLRWVSVPTTASTDAPASGVAVLYSAEGQMVGARKLPRNPDVVLVDSRVVASAPTRFFIAGIGDALATWVESRVSRREGWTNPAGGLATAAGVALAELSWRILHRRALRAVEAVERNEVTEDVESVIEANVLLSGLGFESGGLAGAHAIHDALTALPHTHQLPHGFKVNFDSVIQLLLERRPVCEIDEFITFTASIGLPTSLGDVGLSTSRPDELQMVAAAAVGERSFMHSLPFAVTAEDVMSALLDVDEHVARATASRTQ